MKIVLFPSSVNKVGSAVHVLNLSKLLHKKGLLDEVICINQGWLSNKLESEGIPLSFLPISFKSINVISTNIRVFLFLKKKKKPIIIHLHGRFPLFSSLIAIAFLKKNKWVITVHQFAETGNQGKFKWKIRLETFILKYFIEGIICVSADLKKEIMSRNGTKRYYKIFLINNWIEPMFFKSKLKDINNRFHKSGIRVMAAGRLVVEKGFDILINAINICLKEDLKIKCDIYGEGPEFERLIKMIHENKLNNHVFLKGIDEFIREKMPNYDIFIAPSREESFGIVILEAYDAGVAIITTNIRGLRNIVIPNITGILVEPNNSQSLAEGIKRLAMDPELRKKLTNKSLLFVKKYYYSEKYLKKFLKLYSIVLKPS